MVFQRIKNNIEDLSWFALLTDFLIVVIGIYVGLQIDEWNDNRLDKIKEQNYIIRLDSELRRDVEKFSGIISLAYKRNEMGALLEAAIESDSIEGIDPLAFVQAVDQIAFTRAMGASGIVFEEMKANGDLGLLQDTKLKDALSRYYTNSKAQNYWVPIIQNAMFVYVELISGVLTYDQQFLYELGASDVPIITREEANAVFERLKSRQGVIDWIPRMRSYQDMQLRIAKDLYKDAEAISLTLEFMVDE